MLLDQLTLVDKHIVVQRAQLVQERPSFELGIIFEKVHHELQLDVELIFILGRQDRGVSALQDAVLEDLGERGLVAKFSHHPRYRQAKRVHPRQESLQVLCCHGSLALANLIEHLVSPRRHPRR